MNISALFDGLFSRNSIRLITYYVPIYIEGIILRLTDSIATFSKSHIREIAALLKINCPSPLYLHISLSFFLFRVREREGERQYLLLWW